MNQTTNNQPTTNQQPEYQTIQQAWDALQAVPSYVERRQINVVCEACGKEFEASVGYYEQDRPDNIGYAYCGDCCHW